MKFILPALTISVLCLLPLNGYPSGPEGRKSHHTDGGFTNPEGSGHRSFLDILRWRWERLWKDIPSVDDYSFPLAENDPSFLRSNRQRNTLTWIGHATVLVQIGGMNILTDPQFSDRASPVGWAGPRRAVPPGMAMEDLPPIDVVLISHDHYDSLDRRSILSLRAREGGGETTFFVPLGARGWFEDLGVTNVVELDWWQSSVKDGLEITALPSLHWSKRGFFGRNSTLWASWAARSADFSFLFVGDTGYSPVFKEIGEGFGSFDLAAIPIGAYEPAWIMGKNHINPEEALRLHRDVRSGKSVAIHWGTFALTDEPLDEPPVRLREAMERSGMTKDEFVVLMHGETIVLE